ncbi:MAG: hypothetical protein ACKO96_09335 [Flammeovirgaceae bacterium]
MSASHFFLCGLVPERPEPRRDKNNREAERERRDKSVMKRNGDE